MTLNHLRFNLIHPTWSGTAPVADAWFPELSGSVESRMLMISGRDLLRALALLARMRFADKADMRRVKQLIAAEEAEPDSVYRSVRLLSVAEAKLVVEVAAKVRRSSEILVNQYR
jgi:hypothetical protein